MNYTDYLSRCTDRGQDVTALDNWLCKETSWLTAPASTKLEYHSAFKGGLIVHSMFVTATLLHMKEKMAPELTDESCIIVGMFHDLGKVGKSINEPYYIPQESEWHRNKPGQMYEVNKNLLHIDIATRSLLMVTRFVPLWDEEVQAILYHDGQYIPGNADVAHKECKLTRLLQYADNWAAGALEKEKG